jgi:hypothetical protein
MGIHFFEKRKTVAFVVGAVIGSMVLLLAIGIEPIQMFLKSVSMVQSDKMDHFDALHFEYFFKYFVEGNAISTLVFFFLIYKFFAEKKYIVFLIALLMVLFFLLAGRSYYMAYLMPFSLYFLWVLEEIKIKDLQRNVTFIISFYSFALFLLIPLSIPFNREYGIQFKMILKEVHQKVAADTLHHKIFVPAQLGLEVASNPSSRLIYPFYRINHGKNPLMVDEVVYVFEKKQIKWVKKNFSNFDSLQITGVVLPIRGKRQMSLSGLINPRYSNDSLGLWKIEVKK